MGHLHVTEVLLREGLVEDRCQVESEPHWSVSVGFVLCFEIFSNTK